MIFTFRSFFIFTLLIVLTPISSAFSASSEASTPKSPPPLFNLQSRVLKNGLTIVVVPNPRAPVVTHMLWIRAGAADEPESDSGLAHYLEHLMFKGTPTQAPGAYSRRIAELGGNDNAFTSQDYTAYFVTLPRDRLEDVMKLERDRFLNLAPPAAHIKSELDVVIEERRQRTDNDPLGAFYEQFNAFLHAGTAYDNPIIGWMEDMKRMDWPAVKTFKDKWYTASNMMLVISGDIDLKTATQLAQKYYGDFPVRPIQPRRRLQAPDFMGAGRLAVTSDQITQPQLMIGWRAPSAHQDPKTARTLSVAADLLGGGSSAYLYQTLVVRDKIARTIDLSYDEAAWDKGTIMIAATPAPHVSLATLEEKIHAALATYYKEIPRDAINTSITRLQRSAILARDSVAGPAMIIGQAWATGSTLDQIESWPKDIATVTEADVRQAIGTYLIQQPSLVGTATPHPQPESK